ncbi:MAG: hypothetical protein JSR80_00465 [Verrucomicrobia bacterium]|nr:hypothetical protein [Verrucomicrobiota bacterium]
MKFPLHKALLLILSSTLIISGSAYALYFFSHKMQSSRASDPQFLIRNLAHCGLLPTSYLATLLDLSVDAPTNLYAFDLSSGEKRLLANPYFETAHLSLEPPHTLRVDYQLYRPVARLLDQAFSALSSGGTLIPSTASTLPTLYLGGGDPRLALAIFEKCPDASFVDVSCANSESLGKRQIVVQIDGHLLRITPGSIDGSFDNALGRYRRLKGSLPPLSVVDLRLEHLAFIQEGGAACLTLS